MNHATPIPVLGIPFYNRPDLLRRCLESIDYRVERIVIVDQGPMGVPTDLLRWAAVEFNQRLQHLYHPNAGVAGAWNEILKLFPARWWMLVNNDIQFAPGDLCKMSGRVEYDLTFGREAGVYYGNHGASWFAITDACIAGAGLFDENIYPAYLEDCDYAHRMKLLGIPAENIPGLGALHGNGHDAADTSQGSRTIQSDPELRRKNGITHGRNFEYYRAKWGGSNGEERYTHPFNDPKIPAWAWSFQPGRRALQKREF